MESILSKLIIIVLVIAILAILLYILMGIVLTKLGKLKKEKGLWRSWVPILNLYLLGKLTINKYVGIVLVVLSFITGSSSITVGNVKVGTNLLSFLPSTISNIISLLFSLSVIALLIYSVILLKKLKTNTIPKEEIEQIKPEDKIEVLDFSDDFEIVDLGGNTPIDNPLERKRERRVLIIIILVLLTFAISLPTITKLFKRDNSTSKIDESNKNIKYYKTTEDGLLEIGKEEGNITVNNIKFYNFIKRTNNTLTLVYLPEDEIKNVNDLNIYIELYNSNKVPVYRTMFTSSNVLERKLQKTYTLNLPNDIYKEAYYAKVTILESKNLTDLTDILVCTKTETDGTVNFSYKVTYNFSKNGLTNYIIENTISTISGTDIPSDYENTNKKEAELVTSMGAEELVYNENSIKYKIDLTKIKVSEVKEDYTLGTTKKSVKLGEENSNWSCK